MGVGKTTVGRALADAVGYRFVDNDAGIEAEYDATVRELAVELGTGELHRIEAAQLGNALDSFESERVVIAAAASVVEDEEARARLAGHTVVWLRADPSYLAARVGESDHRPNVGLNPGAALAAQADARNAFFAAVSDVAVRVDGRSVRDIVDDIRRQLVPLPRLYTDLADWFHLLTAPGDYAEEAAFYLQTLRSAAIRPIETLLELGSGGGNNASHLKHQARLTLVDLSPAMVAVSQSLNPDCEHIVGDMRSVRLGRRFDAVFIHDAIDYLTTVDDLQAAIETAAIHCEPGGAVLFAPDHVADSFRPGTSAGGHRDGARSLRYEEQTEDPDRDDTTYLMHMTYYLEEEGAEPRVIEEPHELGLFPRATWLELMEGAGLTAAAVPFDHSEIDQSLEVFVGTPGNDIPVGSALEEAP